MSTEKTKGPGKLPDVVPAKVVDHTKNAKAFKDEWDKRKKVMSKVSVSLPGTRRSVDMSNVEVSDNVISIWTSSDSTLPPDFVFVNAPTSVLNEHGIIVEDQMTAIALVIDGATQ